MVNASIATDISPGGYLALGVIADTNAASRWRGGSPGGGGGGGRLALKGTTDPRAASPGGGYS